MGKNYKPQTQAPNPPIINTKFASMDDTDDLIEIVTNELNFTTNRPPLPPQQYSNNSNLVELQDQEPYNRRQSFLHDMHHEPYWQNEQNAGRHPFQTPKHSQNKKSNEEFFTPNKHKHKNKNQNKSGIISSPLPPHSMDMDYLRHNLHANDPSSSTNNSSMASVTDNTLPRSTNTSQEMAVIDENEDITPNIYINDDAPNHNG